MPTHLIDAESLLFEPEFTMVLGRQYEPFVIPCKPTAPQVKVELLNQDGEVMQNTIPYNDRIGFEVKFEEIHEGYVTCRGILNDTKENIIILYKINRTLKFFFYRCTKIYNRKYLIIPKYIFQHISFLQILCKFQYIP